MPSLIPYLTPMIDPGDMSNMRKHYKRDPAGDRLRQRVHRQNKKIKRLENIAILDMETDPFDNVTRARIDPFLAVLYADHFEPKIVWAEQLDQFVEQLCDALDTIPEPHTIYAHNGGRFDFMFLVHKLRGEVQFKGRGIMRAKLGRHELRDSYHIIPEPLANWKKDKFKYDRLHRSLRDKYREEIIQYCINDCKYLLEIVRKFLDEFGFKISIGSAAMAEVRKNYKVEKFGEKFDGTIRQFFFGGRVQCLQGAGEFRGHYKSYDKNSMYPSVMAAYKHPIGSFENYRQRMGEPGPDTVFINLFARNHNALVARDDTGATTTLIKEGEFFTTIWEYNIAMKYGLIEPWNINYCWDCDLRSDFSAFVLPLYERRQKTKLWLKDHGEDHPQYWDMKKDDTFIKLILNNAYGKFAINPRRFKTHWITDPDEKPPAEWFKSIDELSPDERAEHIEPEFRGQLYWIWSKPNPGVWFNNVGVAASITGAARAELMEAKEHAKDPIYCDTDSIICRDLPHIPGIIDIDLLRLGAWKLEDEFDIVRITGKKQYAGHRKGKGWTDEKAIKIRSKGAGGISWQDFQMLLAGDTIRHVNRAPTFDRYGGQNYIERTLRATAQFGGI